jgi:hypothetical protein
MKKKFIDRWWVRIVALLTIPGLLSGGSGMVSGLLFLALLILILMRVSKTRKSPKSEAEESKSESLSRDTSMPAEGTYILIESSGNFSSSIAGESHYFDAISRATHRRTGEHVMLAEIIREPENKYDSNAVRVEIKGRTVGHIPREDAPSFHELLGYAKSLDKRVFASCRVWISDQEDSFGSVSLDIDDPNSSLPPINALGVPPLAVIWPTGNTLQVTEESKNIENVKIVFEKLQNGIGNSILFELFVDITKLEKPEIHVLFDGLKVGELSPVSGKKFLPAVEKAALSNRRFFVKGEATGNSLAAEIKIFAKSPEQLTESEVRQLLG